MSTGDVLDNIEFDRSVIGVDVPVGSHKVTKREIVAYAEAMGETNPLYLDEEAAKNGPYGTIIAPPGFYHSIRLKQMPDIKDICSLPSFLLFYFLRVASGSKRLIPTLLLV